MIQELRSGKINFRYYNMDQDYDDEDSDGNWFLMSIFKQFLVS